MIPYQVGIELGLTVSEDVILEAGGAGGASIPHVVKEVFARLTNAFVLWEIQIGDYSIHARIGWALTDEVPLLLGRLDVFDEFYWGGLMSLTNSTSNFHKADAK